MSKGIVTINTDASFLGSHKKGSFAFWITCDAGRFKLSGMLKNNCHRPEVAEFKCIINSLHYLAKLGIQDVKRIIINTDCLNVIHLLMKDRANIQKYRLGQWGNPLKASFFNIKQKYFKEAKLECRHVRSHQSTETKREWVNEWCDREAKKQIALWIKENSPAPVADAAAKS